jgi:hypothetical protein
MRPIRRFFQKYGSSEVELAVLFLLFLLLIVIPVTIVLYIQIQHAAGCPTRIISALANSDT